MRNRNLFVVGVIFSLFIAACNPPLPQGISVTILNSQLTISFHMPPSLSLTGEKSPQAASGSQARVIDPNTAIIELWLNGSKAGSLTFFDGVRSGTSWSGTFKGVTAGTYAPGTIVVKLLDQDGSPLTAGTNAAAVTISSGAQNTVSVNALPDASLVTAISLKTRYAVSIPMGASKYLKLAVIPDRGYSFHFLHPNTAGQVVLFNEDGTVLYSDEGRPIAQTFDGPNQDWAGIGWGNHTSQNVYIGVFPQAVDLSPGFACDLFAYSRSADLLVAYRGAQVKSPPDDHGFWEMTGGSLAVNVTKGMAQTFDFRLMNPSAENDYVDLTGTPSVSLGTVTGPAAVTVSQQPGSTRLEAGQDIYFGIQIDASAVQTGSGSVIVQIPNTVPGKENLSFTLNYAVTSGVPRARFWHLNMVIQNGAVIDVGDVPIGQSMDLPFSADNQGSGPLTLSEFSNHGDVKISMNGNDKNGNYTVSPWNGAGSICRLDLKGASPSIEGQSYTSTVSFTSNEPGNTAVSFTVKYRTLLGLNTGTKVDIGNPTTSAILVQWAWSPGGLPDATSFRVYRTLGWAGPYVQIGSNIPTSVGMTISDQDKKKYGLPADALSFSFTDTGLANETQYSYKIDAVLDAGKHPVGHTATDLWGQSITTYSAAKRSPSDSNDYFAPTVLAVGGAATSTWFYPTGETSYYTFAPTVGHSYAVTVTNVSLTSGCNVNFFDGNNWNGGTNVNRWNSQPGVISWTCPPEFDPAAMMVRIQLGANGDCSGGYSIKVSEP